MVNTRDFLPKTTHYLKVPIIGLNAILWLLGLVLIVVGSVCISFFSNFKEFTKESGYKNALSNLTTSAPTGVLVIGIFFILLTLVGCFVAYKEKLVGLVLYTMLMLILLVVLIGIGGKALTLDKEDAVSVIGTSWVQISNSLKNSTITKLEDFLECCCWSESYSNETYRDLCPKDDDGNIKYEDTYCKGIFTEQVSSKLVLVGIAGVVIGCIEFVAMALSLFLIIRICRSPRSRAYDQY
ncbi:hypothetical protein ACTFIY_000468 [Dictyostelium cf. discoideum]